MRSVGRGVGWAVDEGGWHLLVSQMEATFEGQDITVQIRSSKYEEKIITWPESLADDYLHRPIENEFEQMCLYEMTSRCKIFF